MGSRHWCKKAFYPPFLFLMFSCFMFFLFFLFFSSFFKKKEEASGGGVGEEEVVVGAGAASDSPFWRRTGARRAAVPGVLTQTRVSVPSSSSSSSSKHLHAKAAVHGTGTSSTGPNPLTANAAAANQAKHNPPAAAAPAAAPHSSPHVLQHPANAVVSATVAPPAYNKEAVKRNKLEAALVQPVANLEEIRKLCWSGVPRDLRPKIWRLLLGISATHLERRAGLLSRKHAEYFELLPEFGKSDGRSEYESNMLKQIQRDVPRPHLQHAILQTPEVQQALTRMLFLWSLRHPVVGFVQGKKPEKLHVFFLLFFLKGSMTWLLCFLPCICTSVLVMIGRKRLQLRN